MIEVKVYKMTEQYNFEKGCHGESHDYGIIQETEFSDMAKALDFCRSLFGNNIGIFDNRIEYQTMENDAGDRPSDKEMEDFKAGKIDLWSASYSCYLSKIERTDLTNEDLKAAFPDLVEL